MDRITFRAVKTAADRRQVANLARAIWMPHYAPIIGRAQVDYMLAHMQSEAAIADQIASGYEYYLAIKADRALGYAALVPEPTNGQGQLSKIYVLPAEGRAGIGGLLLAHVEQRCRELNLNRLWLTVNRHNAVALAFYRRHGFSEAGRQVTDIGSGYVMDDWVMEKNL